VGGNSGEKGTEREGKGGQKKWLRVNHFLRQSKKKEEKILRKTHGEGEIGESRRTNLSLGDEW